jgi:peptidoglycan hydrolase CwlO-like protein
METVILVSVLSTLGIVAIAVAFVVMFKKLNNKVDVNEQNNYDIEFQDIHRELDNITNDVNRRIDEMDNNHGNEFGQIYSTIDSRCDKLYDLITTKKK